MSYPQQVIEFVTDLRNRKERSITVRNKYEVAPEIGQVAKVYSTV